MVQVHMEISRNLSVVLYVKQGQGNKERLYLNKTKQSRPSLWLKLSGEKKNAVIKEEITSTIYDC